VDLAPERAPRQPCPPFILTLGLIFLGFSGLGISVWPNIIPPHISLWDAAAPPSSQVFMLPGALLIIPVILMYTAWSYYVFRGKVSGSEAITEPDSRRQVRICRRVAPSGQG
jgi:cytochrome d ubiquinol oxidase subunit II